MNQVLRYTLDDFPDEKPRDVVLASDYDAIVAELAGYKESHEKYCPSAARVRALEAALNEARILIARVNVTWVHRDQLAFDIGAYIARTTAETK